MSPGPLETVTVMLAPVFTEEGEAEMDGTDEGGGVGVGVAEAVGVGVGVGVGETVPPYS